MKMKKLHRVPLSPPALAILRAQKAETRRAQPSCLSRQANEVALEHGDGDAVEPDGLWRVRHGFRSSFRNWATEIDKTEYATAERCLAHVTGSDAALAYDRSDRLELRRPDHGQRWADFICPADNVVELRRAGA